MKKFISIILLVTSLMTIFSLSVLAQEGKETPDTTVKSVICLSSTEVKVFFEGYVDRNIVENKTNYTIKNYISDSAIEILNITYNLDSNTAIIETRTEFSDANLYKLQVNNIYSDSVVKVFAGMSSKPKVSVKDVVALSANKVKVFFEGYVNKEVVKDSSNYDIYNNNHVDIKNIEYITYDNTILITTATDLNAGMLYTIDINNICPEGKITRYFAGITSTPEISVEAVIALSSTQVKVLFKGNLDIVSAEDILNYTIIDSPLEIVTAEYGSNDNSITLKISEGLEIGRIYRLVIRNICSDSTATGVFAGR